MQRTILAIASLWMVLGASAQNIIVNGSFELPGLASFEPTRILTNGSTFLPGWTVRDDAIGQALIYAQSPNSDAIKEGAYGLILNQGSGVRTTFRAAVGGFYELSFWLRPGQCKQCVSPAPMEVTISGNVYTIPLVEGWSQAKIQFFATNSVNTLEFFNPSSPSDFKQFGLDEISIQKVPGALLDVRFFPGVIVTGPPNQKYQIQAAYDLNSPVWQTLTNLFLTNTPYIYIDMDPKLFATNPPPHRVYRSIIVP